MRKRLTTYIRPIREQQGFTIVELMIASLVFAIILTVMAAGVTHFSADYYHGVNTSATQTAAGTIMNDIASAIQLDGGTPSTGTGNAGSIPTGYICAGSKEFFYYFGQPVKSPPVANDKSGVYEFDNAGTCYSDPTGTGSIWAARESLLPSHMRVASIQATLNPNGSAWDIAVKIAYGDNDPSGAASLFCAPSAVAGSCNTGASGLSASDIRNITTLQDMQCRSGVGSQFCGISALSTTVEPRIE